MKNKNNGRVMVPAQFDSRSNSAIDTYIDISKLYNPVTESTHPEEKEFNSFKKASSPSPVMKTNSLSNVDTKKVQTPNSNLFGLGLVLGLGAGLILGALFSDSHEARSCGAPY